MAHSDFQRRGISGGNVCMALVAATSAMLLLFAGESWAQTLTVLHAFSGQGDGDAPSAGLIMDRGGRLYGPTTDGVSPGSVFKLADVRSGWVLNTLHNFGFVDDGGRYPNGKLTFGPDGNLYGVNYSGGQESCETGCGVVFKLQPPATACPVFSCPWTETVLYSFTGGRDGGNPVGDIAFDSAGNLYGATEFGGNPSCESGCGVVYELTPSSGGWTQTILHSFGSPATDGILPSGGVVLDPAGNVYGVTMSGGAMNEGITYELSPSNGGWSETILHSFQNLARYNSPVGTLTRDQAGNLYGITRGSYYGGSLIFELSQPGAWTYSELQHWGAERAVSPGLVLDSAGNLYGAVNGTNGSNEGTVFKLQNSNGSWSLITLHSFAESEGVEVNGGLIFDAAGNIYGTAAFGGDLSCDSYGGGCGTVWEITP
jgi:uncharacterized repeat protein (TIGR03803 family)